VSVRLAARRAPPDMADLVLTMARGGARANAGRRSAFPGLDMKPFAMDFTPGGRRALRRLEVRTQLSRNNILAHLTAEHAASLTFDEPGVVFAGKAQQVLTIRMPADVGQLLREARARTGKSYSDLGEALVLRYGSTTTFPFLVPRRRARGHARRAKSHRPPHR
jgi:hypothetical protein